MIISAIDRHPISLYFDNRTMRIKCNAATPQEANRMHIFQYSFPISHVPSGVKCEINKEIYIFSKQRENRYELANFLSTWSVHSRE